MRVGIITDAFPPEVGGIQTYADQYVTHLSEAPEVEAVDVLAFTEGPDETRPSVTVRRVDRRQTPTKLVTGLRWFRRHSFDVVHSLTLYPGGLIAALCSELDPSVRTHATVYGLDAISLADHVVLGPIHRYIFTTLDETLFFSDSTREKTHTAYATDFPSRRIYPGGPTFDETDEPPSLPEGVSDDGFTVLTVARLVERKGIDDLIEAVEPLSDVSLWVVGDGPERVRLEAAVAPDAEDRVSFLGEVSHDQLPALYERADVFCMPSVYLRDEGDVEGLGLVFLEAQRFGLPVIGTRSGGVPEAFADGETGFLVDERAPAQIRRRIRELQTQPDLYREFSERAREFVAAEFSWESCVRNHVDAYRGRPPTPRESRP